MSATLPTLLRDKARLVEDLLPATVAQGFSPEVARAGLEAETESWSESALVGLSDELPTGWQARAPRAVLVIAARTLPASMLRQCLFARALGARVLLKCAAGQEAVGEVLHAIDPAIEPTPFASDDRAAAQSAIALADTVVVLGSDETVRALRAETPAGKGFAAHGHKVSAAWLGPAPSDADVTGLARDVVAWDQAGCLAPQVVWVEGDPTHVRQVGERLTKALQTIERELPLADLSAHRVARQRVVPLVAMLGGELLGTQTTFIATLPEAAFRPSPGPRMVWLLPADASALDALMPILSTLAVARSSTPTLASPSVRLCAPGEMQRPPLTWRQDGLHPLASLLRPDRPELASAP